MHENKKTCEKLEKDEDFHILTSLFPHLPDVPKWRKFASRTCSQVLMDKDMKPVVPNAIQEEIKSRLRSGNAC